MRNKEIPSLAHRGRQEIFFSAAKERAYPASCEENIKEFSFLLATSLINPLILSLLAEDNFDVRRSMAFRSMTLSAAVN